MTYRLEKAADQAAKAAQVGPEMASSAWEAMPAEEREVLLNTVELLKMGHISLARKSLDHYAVVRYRNSVKARRDAIRDARARTLVGAQGDRAGGEGSGPGHRAKRLSICSRRRGAGVDQEPGFYGRWGRFYRE